MSLSKLMVAAACVLCLLLVVLAPAEAVSAQEALSAGGLESSLVGGLGGGGGQQAAEEAQVRLSSPEALAEDAGSRTAFAGYGRDAAVALAKRVFGIARPRWTPPQEGGPGKITGYIGENIAQEVLPDGKHVAVESSVPLQSSVGDGQRQPVSLALISTEEGYVPANPLVPIVIGKNPAEGVSFASGLRMTPVAHAASETPEVVGDSLFYSGTARDTDFMVAPSPRGVEVSWQLLSAESSGENALNFALPAGAQLVMSKEVEGAAEVMVEGQRQLLIMPASASEADGASLPVTYSVSGDTLSTHVDLSGNVDFPVDVDPVVEEPYKGGSWSGWGFSGEGNVSCGGVAGCAEPSSPYLFGKIEPHSSEKSYAGWGVFAPGWPSEGSVTRVDVRDYGHLYSGESDSETGIVNSNGSPVYTYDGENPNDTHSGLLLTSGEFEGEAVAYCADGAGGYDGGPTPLCNESYGGQYFRLTVDTSKSHAAAQSDWISTAFVHYLDTSNIKATSSEEPTVNGATNVLYGSEKWFGSKSGELEAIGSDPAFGVARLSVLIAGAEHDVSREYAQEHACTGIICGPKQSQQLSYNNFGKLPDGNDEIKIEAADASGLTAIWTSTVHVDNTPPHGLAVTGANVKGETINITEGPEGDQVAVEATDGESGVPSSGVRSLGVEVDGVSKGEQGSCSAGPCTAKATWTLNGRELGAGVHTLTVKAIDNAGNEAVPKTYQLVVHAASPVAMGPGSVNPESGDFALESTDVDLKDISGALMVTQHYDSQNVNEGAEGPLGPEWVLGLGQLASLEVLEGAEGKPFGVMLAGPEGLVLFRTNSAGEYVPAPEYSSLTLTHPNSGEYLLENKEKGTSTTFTLPAGAKHWMPTVSKTAASSNTLTDEYRSVEVNSKMIVEPTEELASHIGKESCPRNFKEMGRGCRALRFYYGSEESKQSEAKGEKQSEWGWYANRLTTVVAVVWSTSAEKMEEVPVAEFAYDHQGRLRAKWDPRIKPVLETIYGYDSENHVTAESAPGQQPWLMTYGTIAGETSLGRLIKVMRPKASTALWGGQLPEKTEEPSISGSPVVGNRLAVSNGKWAHEPLTYGYQWEDCNTSGEYCAPIGGATNANYTPVSSDVGHTLVVEVSATNAGGTVTAASARSITVVSTPPNELVRHTQSIDSGNSINAASCLPASTSCVISDSKGNAYYSTNVSAKNEATWHSWTGPGTSPSEAVDCPSSGLCLLADGSHNGNGGSLYYASSLGGSWSEAYTPSYGVDAIACASASLCVDGQDGDGYLRDSTKPASSSWSLVSQGSAAMTAASCLSSSSFCVLADSAGNVHVAPTAKAIEDGDWTQTNMDGSTALTGVACLTTTSCLAVDGSGNLLEMTVNAETGAGSQIEKVPAFDGTNALTGISCPTSSLCAMVDNHGNLLVASQNSAKSGLAGDLTSVSCASTTLCLTANTTGEVTAFNPTEEAPNEHEGAQQSPQPGTTLEYGVPVSGSGAPYPMSAKNVEEWGQKDDPVEAFEVFPEEHAQGWPASGHTGSSVYYMDDEAQIVNVAGPSEGIATTEYEDHNVVRSLSADNRAKALKEPNPAEAAGKLATKSKYSEENGELSEVTGPEHKVKLSDGEEVEARNHVRYFYDEGAPENSKGEVEEYGLVTKTTDGALLGNGEEKDVRTTLTGYSGEKGEGWTLRAPTSTTTEPDGVDLVSSTKYNKETGAVEETRTPGGNAETISPPEAKEPFGKYGSGNGQMNEPVDTAVGPEGDVYVVDQENRRIEKFTSSGTFVEAFTVPSADKELNNPNQVAIGANGDMYVADTTNNRVVVLNKEGKFVEAWTHPDLPAKKEGEETEGVALNEPVGVAVTPGGNVFVSNYGSDEVLELNEAGKLEASFGVKGAIGGKGTGDEKFEGPGLLAFSEGVLYVADSGNKRVQKFSTANGAYIGQFGSAGAGEGQFEDPWGIAVAPATGDLYVSDEHNNRVEQFSPAGKFLASFGYWGSENAALKAPQGLSISTSGKLYVADMDNNRVSVWSLPEAAGLHETYSTQFGSAGSGPGQFEYAAAPAVTPTGHVLVTDDTTNLIQEFSSQGKYLASYGGTGESAGKFEGATGVAVNQATGDMYVGDCGAHSIQELNPKGEYIRSLTSIHLQCPGEITIDSAGNVWTVDMSADQVEEWGEAGSFLHAYGEKGSGNLQFNEPVGITYANKDIYVADTKNNRVQIMSTSGAYVGQFGSEGSEGGEFERPEGLAADAAGDVFVLDSGNNRVQEISPTNKYIQSIGTHGVAEGQLNGPQGIAVTAADDIYVTDAQNHRVEKWIPAAQAVHDTRTIYYSPEKEAGIEACENKRQWAGLVCQTEPLAQPTDSSAEPKGEELPRLPVVRTEYNMWYEPVKSIETIGSKTRTKTTSYEGERVTEQSVEAGAGKAVYPVHDKYSSTLGMPIEQSQESEGEGTKTVNQLFNTLGQLESYTDAEGNATTYSYDQYGRPTEVDYDASKLDGMGARQTLKYEETTGAVAEVDDIGGEGTYEGKGAGAFKASFGLEGEMTSETYPNNMTATYGYNSIGEATSLAYTKNNHCIGAECKWFEDTLTPSIHGETMTQSSSLAKDQYRYEQPGRLAEVQETPTGEHCTARIYAQNEEGDRTSLTTRESGSSECTATEGGTVERHTYDEANRLTDEETKYEPLGNITKLPGADAGKYELETEYYASGQARSQTQHEISNTYLLDPEGRPRLTETTAKLATSKTISHYAGAGGSTPSWTYNQTSSTWTRNIMSFGGLAAVEESGKQAILQLRDLQGNIIETASLNETRGEPLTKERSTEYGVPVSEKPTDKYGWLGTSGVSSNLPSGSIVQDGATYVPQLGSPLQAAPPEIPAQPLTVIPFVLTSPPPHIVKGQGEGETPNGNLPFPEGEEVSGCTGLSACIARRGSSVHSVACWLRVMVGESNGKVWGRAWAWCPGRILAIDAEMNVGLYPYATSGYEFGYGPRPIFAQPVYGEQYPHQLYDNVEGLCRSELSYKAKAIFKPLPTWKPLTAESPSWECGESPLMAVTNTIWFFDEILSAGKEPKD
jgi:YD repeat-containing protein